MANNPKSASTKLSKSSARKFEILLMRHSFLINLLWAIIFGIVSMMPIASLMGYSTRGSEYFSRKVPSLLLFSLIFLIICVIFIIRTLVMQRKCLDEIAKSRFDAKNLPPELQHLQKCFRLARGITIFLCFTLVLWVFFFFEASKEITPVGGAYGLAILFLGILALFIPGFFVAICCWVAYFWERGRLRELVK